MRLLVLLFAFILTVQSAKASNFTTASTPQTMTVSVPTLAAALGQITTLNVQRPTKVLSISVTAATVPVGSSTLTITKNGTSILSNASFDLTTLTANTPTLLTLSTTASLLSILPTDVITVTVTNGVVTVPPLGVSVSILFQ